MTVTRRAALLSLAALPLAACGGPAAAPPGPQGEAGVLALAAALGALGPGVDPAEAGRVARVAYATSARLRVAYGIEDPPLVHNAKVNAGLKPRGLCYHWAEDMEAALREAVGFRTLAPLRGIANYDTPWRIEHSSVIVAARGAGLMDGIVIDPWRAGGALTWLPARDDAKYPWRPRLDVQRERYREQVARGELPPGLEDRVR